MFTKVIGKTNEPDDSGQGAYSPRHPATPARTRSSGSGLGANRSVSSPSAGSNVRNILSSDVEITGSVKFTNDLLVDGRIDGEITSEGNLTIGENAKIKAEIKTASVVIHGKVHGNITVADRVELRAGSEVVGDIKAQILTVEAGAVFVGKSEVGTPSTISAGQTAKPAEFRSPPKATAEPPRPAPRRRESCGPAKPTNQSRPPPARNSRQET